MIFFVDMGNKVFVNNIRNKLNSLADEFAVKYSIPVVNKRISVTPISHVGAGFSINEFIKIAEALDTASEINQ